MATSHTITSTNQTKSKSRRTAFDAQPLPKNKLQSNTATERNNEEKQLTWGDAGRVVTWLNASQGTASGQRIVSLRDELVKLPSDWAIHNTHVPWTHPGSRKGWDRDQRQLEQRHRTLNELLSRYVFFPRVTHRIGGLGRVGGEWRSAMLPDEDRRWFTTRIGDETISEADAVMSLLRLFSTRDLSKIRLCETCRDRWLFAAKRNYRFCTAECRETFYAKAPDYHDRKAKNQREYRERLKLKDS